MSPVISEPPTPIGQSGVARPHSQVKSLSDVEARVDSAMASWHQSNSLIHDRRSHRFPFAQTLCLVGLNQQMQPEGVPLLVNGRDISIDGLSFRHRQPIAARFVAVTWQSASGPETQTVKLSWCRFGRDGGYVSGGRFLREAPVPARLVEDWNELSEA